MPENSGTWVYAVTASGRPAVPELPGVAGGPLHAVATAGLTAIVSDVDLGEYGEEPLRRNLENLEWLEATARAHHEVIDTVAGTGPVVPMQLATVYRGDERVAAMLAERRDDFQTALDRIRARSEWGIKIYASGPSEAAGDSAAPSADTGRPSNDPARAAGAARPGAAYLQRRRSELSARERAQHEAAASAEAIHAELCALSAATRLHKPQHPQLTGRSEPMILNSTYLVADEQASAFAAAADELASGHPGVCLELTGPWPPYSFTLPEEEDARASEADSGTSEGEIRA
jgi:Gas vesicle synthesis protein GvpL/GvpF